MKRTFAYLLFACCALLPLPAATAQSGEIENAVAAKIETLPKEQRFITRRNAVTFTESDWRSFLSDLSRNYLIGPDGKLFAINEPAIENLPQVPDEGRFHAYVSWRMVPVRGLPYRQISGTVVSVPKPGIIMVSEEGGAIPIRVGPKSATFAEGDPFESWCVRGEPYTIFDDLGQTRSIRSYVPVEVKKPELIDISNYLVKSGQIFGLAPSLTKMCPVCKGFRKYSPNAEVPSETVVCGSCDGTGKVQIRPLYIVYTGSKD